MKEIESIIIIPQYLRAKLTRIVMEMVIAMPENANAWLIMSLPKIVQFLDVSLCSQSHYIEVLRCRAIQNWLWIFSLFCAKFFFKKSKKQFLWKRYYATFSADATIFLKILQPFFAHENIISKYFPLKDDIMIRFRILLLHEDIKKQASKIAHDQPNFFFSTDNLRKISAILIISSIKMAPALLPYIILYRANLCVSFYIYISISMHTS